MLPLELLKVIFGALSRDDLEALMLTNVLFRDIMLRDFAEEPLRDFAALKVHCHQNYTFVLPTQNRYRCWDNDDFSRRMRLARLGKLKFGKFSHSDSAAFLEFDENIFSVLLPHKDSWRDGIINTPRYFASPSLCERAFGELFFCESMSVAIFDDSRIQPFVSLPAIRECSSLCILDIPRLLSVAEILEWLHDDARSVERKRLQMDDDILDGSIANLVQHLKTDFDDSKTPCRYVVESIVDVPYNGQSGRFVNKDTSEELVISHHGAYDLFHSVKVERKTIEEK